MRRSLGRIFAVLGIAAAGAGLVYPLVHGVGPLAQSAQSLLASASVSMNANIPATPENTLAAQLQAKQASLDAREASLVEREVSRKTSASASDFFGVASFILSILLLVLAGTNFYLDERRALLARQGAFSVDLRGRA